MSTWTSEPASGARPGSRLRLTGRRAVLLLMVLAGCNLSGKGGVSRTGTGAAGARSATVEVAGRSLQIAGPRGYCVDAASIEVSGANAFALLGPCPVISRSPLAPHPDRAAILTATFGPATTQGGVQQSAQRMEAFFRSDAGRAALSRSGDAGSVLIMDSFFNDGVYYLRARDSSPAIVPGAAPDSWRAWFDLPGQIASVSVTGTTSQPLSPDQGLDLTRRFVSVLRERNGAPGGDDTAPLPAPGTAPPPVAATPPAASPPPEMAAAAPPPAAEPAPAPTVRKKRRKRDLGLGNIGLLRRLFY